MKKADGARKAALKVKKEKKDKEAKAKKEKKGKNVRPGPGARFCTHELNARSSRQWYGLGCGLVPT